VNHKVVMHREQDMRGRSPSISTHGSLEQNNETASWNGTPDSNLSVPQRILATTIVNDNPTATTGSSRLFEMESPQRQSQEEQDLDATPRIGSASSQVIDPSTANGPVPMFPFGRQR
jgi:hypothetical protein